MAHPSGGTRITLRFFGEFRINDSSPGGLNNRHLALIVYLALRHPAPVPRSGAAFKLWADSTEEQALTNLRKALHHIKQNFPDGDFIQAGGRALQFQPDIQLDISDFMFALDSAGRARLANDSEAEQSSLETALTVFRGDLLPNLYDDWLIPERERLRELFIRSADRLITLLEARQHYRDAIRHAQRLLQTDNLREESYRTLIRLYALNSDRAAALNVYHACAGALSKELGIEPDSSTRELYERLLKNDAQLTKAAAPARPISAPLVAREREWKTLLAEWKKASNGDLRTTLISGEAGIGKTRLAEDLLHWASRQGFRVAPAACYSAEGGVSFAPISFWLRGVSLEKLELHHRAELSRLLPELRSEHISPPPMTENWQKQVFFESMARALLAENQPLLLLLDDVQWCDNDTLEWLRYFLRFDKNAKILLLLTLRAEELPANHELQLLLVDLRAEGRLTEMELNRLDEKQTTELGAHLLGKNFSKTDSSALFRESEGVPLFVVELANTGVRVEPAIRTNEAGLPPRLKAVLEARLARLSSPARAVVESAAVIGREFDFDLLRKISELEEGATVSSLDELWRLRMVRERGGRYDFSHDKLREATLANISPIRLRWLHQRAGEALEAGEAYPRIADHFERAGLPNKALDYYQRAARQAQEVFAFGESLEHLRRALLLESNPAALANLHEQRGDVLKVLGQSEGSFQAFEQALGLADAPLQRTRLARKQITLTSRHAVDIAREKYGRALADIHQSQDDSDFRYEWIELQFAWIQALYWKLDADGMDALLEQIRHLVEQYGAPAQKIHYHHRVINSTLVRERGRLGDQHLALARENIARAVAFGDSHLISTTKRTLSMVAYFAEHFDDCISTFREAIELSEKNGDMGSLLIARVYISLAYRRVNNIEAVRKETQALMSLLQSLGRNPEYKGVGESNLAWLAYREGNMNDALRYAQTAREIWSSLKTPYPVQWCGLIILFAFAVGKQNTMDILTYTRALLDSQQQYVRADVESALRSVLDVDPADRELFLHLCRETVEVAKKAGYL